MLVKHFLYRIKPMKDILLLEVKRFIEKRFIPGKPLLLGYSGGPDSKALLYLFLECRRFFAFDLHLAHIDHGWREESRLEALAIKEEAGQLKLPLHLHVLKPEDFRPGNLEEQGRNYRHQFFSELYRLLDCQAILIGHHADDRAEVVLKRVFEGSSLFALSGLSFESQMLGMQVWRPFLGIHKKEILAWLFKKKLNYFQDSTNSDARFLRGRMREEMIPFLTTSFGKEIASNLCRLGDESREIRDYFCTLNRPIMDSLYQGSEGRCIDLNPFLPVASIQLKYLLKEWMRKEGVTFSKQILEGITSAVVDRLSGKKFNSKDGIFFVESGIISFCNHEK